MNKPHKILITGAHGQVGSDLAQLCEQRQLHFLPYTRDNLDITDPQQIITAIEHFQPTFIINAAAYTAVDRAESEPELAYAINVLAVKNLALACAQYQIPFIHLSTDYIFDGTKNSSYIETDLAAPQSVYGLTKWQGEEIIRKTLTQHIILRVSWVFGRFGNNFVKTMLNLMQQRETLNIVADQRGGPTYATDIANAILTMTKNPVWGTYHFCGSPITTWYDFAKNIFNQAQTCLSLRTQSINPITTEQYPTPAKRPKNSALNCDKFFETYGECERDWQKGLVEMIRLL
jgi:dTDP-4-dehydrorhamnose reductase